MLLKQYLPYILAGNVVLTLLDAAIGYHVAPILVRATATDPDSREQAARTVRAMLALVVALYSFFSCLAYFRQKPVLLLVVTAVIVADIVTQLFLCRKLMNQN